MARPVAGDSTKDRVPGVKGTNTAAGPGVMGISDTGIGVLGESAGNEGVRGISHNPHAGVVGINDSTRFSARTGREKQLSTRPSGEGPGGWFESTEGEGVRGVSHGLHAGVVGINDSPGKPHVVFGSPPSPGGNGGWFESKLGEGVRGTSANTHHGGVVGVNTGGGIAVYATSDNGVGVWGTSVNNEGIHAASTSKTTAAMAVYQLSPDSEHPALYAKHAGHLVAAVFEGNVVITGHITFANADCAEDFDIAPGSSAEPGTVMVLDDESHVRESFHPYDKRVAGVISGAGNFKPGLVLDKQQSRSNRKPIALLGKVYCKVDAQFGPIEVGDLLTTSPTAGHAMRVADPLRAFGAVIGKALRPLASGQALVPILIALQ
jgi:hypothetical protein